MQVTPTGAQQALETVIAEITSATGRGPGAARVPPEAATTPPARPVRRTAAALSAAPDVLAERARRAAHRTAPHGSGPAGAACLPPRRSASAGARADQPVISGKSMTKAASPAGA